eukprot:scaffold2952_cov312-Pinguiococcus_pyrenoidosus.AAC.2
MLHFSFTLQEAAADARTTELVERATNLSAKLVELQHNYDMLSREHKDALDALRNKVRGDQLDQEGEEGVFRLTYLKQAVLAYMKCGKGKMTHDAGEAALARLKLRAA